MKETSEVIGPYSVSAWNTMLNLKQGLDYMVRSKKPKFKNEIEDNKLKLRQYLNRRAA